MLVKSEASLRRLAPPRLGSHQPIASPSGKRLHWALYMVIGEKENHALTIIDRLRAAGFTAYLAGGCVRDRILGVAAKDYDIATDARPEAVQRLFDHTVAVGARFGVIMVMFGDQHFEVTTFRADAEYLDGRHPSAVRFGTIEEDVQRRDFT